MPVEAMVMTEMRVMMAAHPGIGVQHARLHMHGLDDGGVRATAVAGSHRRGGENGSCEQGRGNCLEHGGRLLTGITELTGRMAGLFDHADDLKVSALNPF